MTAVIRGTVARLDEVALRPAVQVA
jgi:hypothetical protein